MAIKASNQISILDVTDAYSVILTSEAYTFVGGVSGVGSGSSCTTDAIAYCGTNACSNVTVTAADIVCPTGISASVANSGSSKVTITFTTTATISTACEATIPVVVDGITVNKKFSFAVAKTGASGINGSDGKDGKGVKSTAVSYQVGTNGTTAPTGTWETSVQATTKVGEYLWTRTIITYTDNTTSILYSVAAHGATGAQGATGAAGADAITLSITTSNGSVLKNNSGSTVLTAHVYKAGVEQTISTAGVVANSLGTIKWYKGSGTTAVATANTLTVSASDVTNVVAYTCQLEG